MGLQRMQKESKRHSFWVKKFGKYGTPMFGGERLTEILNIFNNNIFF
jgi:hypothetical protein